MRRIGDYLVYLVVRVLICAVQALRLETGAVLAGHLAWLFCDVLKLREAVVDDNLAHAFPELSAEERKNLSRNMWNHLFLLVLEVAHAPRKIHETNWRRYISLRDSDKLVRRLINKILNAVDRIVLMEEEDLEDADVAVVSYGITYRVAQRAVEMAREKGLKVGTVRLITVWPFPEKRVREIAGRVKALVVPELNMGQISREVERVAGGAARTICVPHAGGSVHRPEQILEAIEEAVK